MKTRAPYLDLNKEFECVIDLLLEINCKQNFKDMIYYCFLDNKSVIGV